MRKNPRSSKAMFGRKRALSGEHEEIGTPKKPSQKKVKVNDPIIDVDDVMDVSMSRDIAYSQQVWISQSPDFPIDLNMRELSLVTGEEDNGWLNDVVIDYCQSLIKKEHPSIGGLESCTKALSFKAEPGKDLLQIINTDVNGPGVHWIAFSTVGCKDGVVNIFDSSDSAHLRSDVVECIAKKVKTPDSMLTLNFHECPIQSNANDCGVYAIANLVAIVNGIDLSKVDFIESEIRGHLRSCMEEKEFSPFPASPTTRIKSSQVKSAQIVPIFCSCRMPEDDKLYFTCSGCDLWFHPACEGLKHKTEAQIKKARQLKCMKCQTLKKAKKIRTR